MQFYFIETHLEFIVLGRQRNIKCLLKGMTDMKKYIRIIFNLTFFFNN